MTNIWSGGCAFEYFFDSQGLGITDQTTSQDGTISTNADFTTLVNELSNLTLSTTVPSSATPALPACTSDANMLSSSNLPPTPNQNICSCLSSNAWACEVNSGTTPVIIGALIDTACSLLAGAGGSCDPIAANGQTGVYGNFSFCSPTDKLNFVISAYYSATNFASTSCNFAGNATINSNVPTASAAAASVTSACLAGQSVGVFVPTSSPTSSGGSSNGGGSSSGSSGKSSASTIRSEQSMILAFLLVAISGLLGGTFVLMGST